MENLQIHKLRDHISLPFGIDETVPDWCKQTTTGTSVMAVEFPDGVVIGADSRTTQGTFISDQSTDKLTKVADTIYCCRSGVSSHTQAIADIVTYHLDFKEKEMDEPPTVETAANIFRELCYNYRDDLVSSIICAGWDKIKGGQVYSVPLGGMLMREQVAIGGSGSSYIYGYVDSKFKVGMNKEECIELVSSALSLAMGRDGSSGGIIRLGIITKDGVERRVLSGEKLPKSFNS